MSNWDNQQGELPLDRSTSISIDLLGDYNSHQLISVRRPRVRICPCLYCRPENTSEMLVRNEAHQMTETDSNRPPRVRRQPQYQRDAITQLERRAAEMIVELDRIREILEPVDQRTEEEKRVDRANAERRESEKAARLVAFNKREDEITYTNKLYDEMIKRQRLARRH